MRLNRDAQSIKLLEIMPRLVRVISDEEDAFLCKNVKDRYYGEEEGIALRDGLSASRGLLVTRKRFSRSSRVDVIRTAGPRPRPMTPWGTFGVMESSNHICDIIVKSVGLRKAKLEAYN